MPRDVWFYFLLHFSFCLRIHGWLRLSDPCSLSRSCLLSCHCSLLKLGDLSPTEVSQRSFKQIAKENFSMPLRDNYQTAQLPRSSHWVITFPRLLLFFLRMKPSVFKALTIDNSPASQPLRLLDEYCGE